MASHDGSQARGTPGAQDDEMDGFYKAMQSVESLEISSLNESVGSELPPEIPGTELVTKQVIEKRQKEAIRAKRMERESKPDMSRMHTLPLVSWFAETGDSLFGWALGGDDKTPAQRAQEKQQQQQQQQDKGGNSRSPALSSSSAGSAPSPKLDRTPLNKPSVVPALGLGSTAKAHVTEPQQQKPTTAIGVDEVKLQLTDTPRPTSKPKGRNVKFSDTAERPVDLSNNAKAPPSRQPPVTTLATASGKKPPPISSMPPATSPPEKMSTIATTTTTTSTTTTTTTSTTTTTTTSTTTAATASMSRPTTTTDTGTRPPATRSRYASNPANKTNDPKFGTSQTSPLSAPSPLSTSAPTPTTPNGNNTTTNAPMATTTTPISMSTSTVPSLPPIAGAQAAPPKAGEGGKTTTQGKAEAEAEPPSSPITPVEPSRSMFRRKESSYRQEETNYPAVGEKKTMSRKGTRMGQLVFTNRAKMLREQLRSFEATKHEFDFASYTVVCMRVYGASISPDPDAAYPRDEALISNPSVLAPDDDVGFFKRLIEPVTDRMGPIQYQLIVQLGKQDMDSEAIEDADFRPKWEEMFKLKMMSNADKLILRLLVKCGKSPWKETSAGAFSMSELLGDDDDLDREAAVPKVPEKKQLTLLGLHSKVAVTVSAAVETNSRELQKQFVVEHSETTRGLKELGMADEEIAEVRLSFEMSSVQNGTGEVLQEYLPTVLGLLGVKQKDLPEVKRALTQHLRTVVDLTVDSEGRRLMTFSAFLEALHTAATESKRKDGTGPKASSPAKFKRSNSRVFEDGRNDVSLVDRFNISPGRAMMLRQAFEDIDTDGSNSVDLQELASALSKLDAKVNEEKLAALFATVDKDASGSIDFHEFITCMVLDGSVINTSKSFQLLRDNLKGAQDLPSFMKLEDDSLDTKFNPDDADFRLTAFESIGVRYLQSARAQKVWQKLREEIQKDPDHRDANGELSKRERRKTKAMERAILIQVTLAGAISGTIAGLAELFSFQAFGTDGTDDSLWEKEFFYFWTIVIVATLAVSTWEIGTMYYLQLRHVMMMSAMAGLALNPLNRERCFLIGALCRAALEMSNPRTPSLGVNPLRNAKKAKIMLLMIAQKGKTGITTLLVRILVRRLARRAVATAVLPFVAIPVNALWNCWTSYHINKQSRMATLGPLEAVKTLDAILGARKLNSKTRVQVLRAIGTAVVIKQEFHFNLYIMLAEAKKKLGFVGISSIDDCRMFTRELPILPPRDQIIVLQTLTLATIIDGSISRKEQRYLNSAAACCGYRVERRQIKVMTQMALEGDPSLVVHMCMMFKDQVRDSKGFQYLKPPDTKEDIAAVKIQSIFRGHLARNCVKDFQRDCAASVIQFHFRRFLAGIAWQDLVQTITLQEKFSRLFLEQKLKLGPNYRIRNLLAAEIFDKHALSNLSEEEMRSYINGYLLQ